VSFRRAIVDYLSRLHEEFLSRQSLIIPFPVHKWHPDFNLESVEIPLSKLPEHPLEKSINVHTFTDSQIKSI
jgi:hypothetical protein